MDRYDLEEKIEKLLPHGSGINYDWSVEIKNKKAYCRNAYDHMNEYGMYDGVYPFTVIYSKSDMTFKYRNLKPSAYYFINKYQLTEYLEETLYESFKKISKILSDTKK